MVSARRASVRAVSASGQQKSRSTDRALMVSCHPSVVQARPPPYAGMLTAQPFPLVGD
jgi:hypothetical protein